MSTQILLAKGLGGVAAIGGVGGTAYAFKDKLISLFTQEISHIYVVGSQSMASPDGTALYKDVEGKKVKNYKCKFNNIEYECDIVKKIDKTAITTKYISEKDIFKDLQINVGLTDEQFKVKDDLFLLKVDIKDKKEIDLNETTHTLDVVELTGTKKFGEIKPIFGKKGETHIKKTNLFLTKIKSVGTTDKAQFTVEASKTYKCKFNFTTEPKKECKIYKFSSTASTELQTSVNFVGKEEEVTANTTLKPNEHYLIKFTGTNGDAITKKEYLKKTEIFLTEDNNESKTIEFSLVSNTYLFSKDTSGILFTK